MNARGKCKCVNFQVASLSTRREEGSLHDEEEEESVAHGQMHEAILIHHTSDEDQW
jgi:hypothetical protein